MARIVWYLASCAVLGLVLWWMATTKPEWAMPLLWIIAWVVGLVVTWKVARRDGRNPVAWSIVALLIGPLAWMVMAADKPDG